ncbi:MAG: hypothetical protein WBL63_16770 [Candidatus Acidiferrum sp.]
MKFARRLFLLLSFLALAAEAQEIGKLTVLEGSLRLIRGVSLYSGSVGIPLEQGDILESSEAGFAQLEFPGGPIVALGPSTRLYILQFAPATAKTKAAHFVLLSGWLKAEPNSAAGTYRYDAPLLGGTTGNGTFVLHVTHDDCDIYIESGPAMVGEISREGNLHQPQAGKTGDFFSRRASKSLTISSHWSPGFVDSMPRAFKDTLPPIIDKFKAKKIEMKPGTLVSYNDVHSWLTMPEAWRRGFVPRFRPRLSDREFHAQIEANLAEHFEWDKILHPEKYRPETPPVPAQNSDHPS